MRLYTQEEVLELIDMPKDKAVSKLCQYSDGCKFTGNTELMMTNEVVKTLGLSRSMLHKHINSGKISPAGQDNRGYNLYKTCDVLRLKEELNNSPVERISLDILDKSLDLVSTNEAIKILGVSRVTLYKYIKSGKISPAGQTNKSYKLYRIEEVKKLKDDISGKKINKNPSKKPKHTTTHTGYKATTATTKRRTKVIN